MPVQWLEVLQTLVHYGLHVLAPGLVAYLFFRSRFKEAWLIMLATMLVDLDHLFAWPDVFVPDRCGIGFHPLHSWGAIGVYALMLYIPQTRIVGAGLLLHMFADAQDCLWIFSLSE